jgi:hypothetical protein
MDYFDILFDKTVIFFIANSIYVLSYSLTNMLWLRLLAVTASLLTVPYFYFQLTPLWSALFWQLCFFAVNFVNLALLLHGMRKPKFNAVQQRLSETLFSDLKPHELKPLFKLAKEKQFAKGEILLKQSAPNETLYLLLDGECSVIIGQDKMANIGVNEFIGEMSFVSGEPVSRDVLALTDLSLYQWNVDDLEKLFLKKGLYKTYMYSLCGIDMANKLRAIRTPTLESQAQTHH